VHELLVCSNARWRKSSNYSIKSFVSCHGRCFALRFLRQLAQKQTGVVILTRNCQWHMWTVHPPYKLKQILKWHKWYGSRVLSSGIKRRVLRWNRAEVSEEYTTEPALFVAYFKPVSCLAYSSILKMGATCSSEVLIEFHRTSWPYIPQDNALRTSEPVLR
jgi:hypothetical protein